MSSIAATLSAVRDNRGRRLPVVRSIEMVVRNYAESCTMFIFHFLLEYSLMSPRVENVLDSRSFWLKFYVQNSTYYCIIITHEVAQ